ncbi:YqaA family protein [Paracraurococcus lichenis]|uniref:YqaA family protein n=1 Tax=Paracraurococcus lichenis TaxID=3064888 RepID=A0ABT9DZR0_9PROT|nr:YqaA family protein [Paracraurococcus sp. LOR1-02]MDO9709370.1 YqaA family protein [Paracraurococcus sp. LOR1-02]
MIDLAATGGLFLVAFGAATILPFQSEPLLVGLLLAGDQPPWLLVLVASLGNTLGSAANWVLGRWIHRWRDRSWFPVKPAALAKAEGWYRRWGRWSLLLSWAPVMGDPLTVIAGVLREPFWVFLLLVAAAKTGRYVVLALVTLGLM